MSGVEEAVIVSASDAADHLPQAILTHTPEYTARLVNMQQIIESMERDIHFWSTCARIFFLLMLCVGIGQTLRLETCQANLNILHLEVEKLSQKEACVWNDWIASFLC